MTAIDIDFDNGPTSICGRCGEGLNDPSDLLDHLCDQHGICGHDD